MPLPTQGDVGTQSLVNTTPTSTKSGPASTPLSNGGYLVTWFASPAGNVFGQFFTAAGVKDGSQFQIGTSVVRGWGGREDAQLKVTELDGGNIVVGWVSSEGSEAAGSSSTEAVQVIINANKAVGQQSVMNTTTTANQSPPEIVALDNGGYFASWFDGYTTTTPGAVRGQYFNADGTKSGAEIQIGTANVSGNNQGVSDQNYANMPRLEVAKLADGNVVVGWMAAGTPITNVASIIDSTTKTAGAQTTILTVADGNASGPDIVALKNGGYFASWMGEALTNTADGQPVYGQFFNADGTKLGTQMTLSTATTPAEGAVSLGTKILDATILKNGNIAITWTTENSTLAAGSNTTEAVSVIIDTTTRTSTVPLVVNERTIGNEGATSITALPDGRFFMAWMNNDALLNGNVVMGQFLNADGTKSGPNLTISQWGGVTGDDGMPAIEAITLENGDVSVSWHTIWEQSGQNGPQVANVVIKSNITVVCFAAGTMITTISGDMPIETLEAGDLVLTADHSYQKLLWVGKTKIDRRQLGASPNLAPIRIPAGALGNGLPTEPLLVSPQHRVLVRSELVEDMTGAAEVLVAAKHLIGTAGIHIARDVTEVEYWHFLFAQHEVVFANGAPSESLFTGPMALNAVSSAARSEILALFPELAKMDHDELLHRAARPIIKGRIGRDLALRHKHDHQPLLAQSANH